MGAWPACPAIARDTTLSPEATRGEGEFGIGGGVVAHEPGRPGPRAASQPCNGAGGLGAKAAAGSGALGLEALSRGAASATLVESDPAAVAVLEDNVAHLGLPGAHVVAVAVERWLAVDPEPRYDLALVDPPYELDVGPVLELLLPWMADDGVVAVERATRGPELAWPDGFEPLRERRYGAATLWYARVLR